MESAATENGSPAPVSKASPALQQAPQQGVEGLAQPSPIASSSGVQGIPAIQKQKPSSVSSAVANGSYRLHNRGSTNSAVTAASPFFHKEQVCWPNIDVLVYNMLFQV